MQERQDFDSERSGFGKAQRSGRFVRRGFRDLVGRHSRLEQGEWD